MKEENEIVITDEFGVNTSLKVLSFVDDPLKENTYIIYTDGSVDEMGQLNMFASLVTGDEENIVLENVLEEDLDFINMKMQELQQVN